MPLIAWIIESKFGRWFASVFAAVVAVALLLWRVFAAGKAAEKAARQAETIRNYENRAEVEDELSKTSPDARRDRLRQWVSDGE